MDGVDVVVGVGAEHPLMDWVFMGGPLWATTGPDPHEPEERKGFHGSACTEHWTSFLHSWREHSQSRHVVPHLRVLPGAHGAGQRYGARPDHAQGCPAVVDEAGGHSPGEGVGTAYAWYARAPVTSPHGVQCLACELCS